MKSCLLILGLAAISLQTAAAKTIVVNSTADSTANDGQCTLREAITAANTNNQSGNKPGECVAGASGLDTINFNIPGAGVRTITLTPGTPLPTITQPVVIDGYSQPGSKANTKAIGNDSVHSIELNGNSQVCGALVISGGNSTIRGLVINRFNGNCGNTAILLQTGGSNKVEGCFLGLNATGTAASTNRDYGVRIENSANNLIGGTTPAVRNVIAGNNTQIYISGNSSSGTTIQGNYIGTNAAGDAPLSNGGVSQSVTGINVNTNADTVGPANTLVGGTTVGARNVISGNAAGNVNFFGSTATGNVIQGNYIGLNAAGKAAVGLSGPGIALTYSSNFKIGGASAGAGNVISGNSSGIGIAGNSNLPADNNLIQGNLIGTNAAGTAPVGNGNGIVIAGGGKNNVIGGVVDGARNVVSGNDNRGIVIQDGDNTVQGNFVGTDITGTAKVGNVGGGIVVGALFGLKATGVKIGGTTAAARNVVSGNGGDGIVIGGDTTTLVQGNYVGTDLNGTGHLGNGLAGISLSGNNNTVGGTGADAGNLIAFNGAAGPNNGDGVIVYGSSTDGVQSGLNNAILGNSIFANGRLGINLYGGSGIDDASGVTPNDAGDADTGGNNLQNYPVLKTASIEGTGVHVTGTLNSSANTTYRIEFFGNDAIDASGFGEGKTYLGFTNVVTNGSGNAAFNLVLPNAAGLRITSTATDPNGNTSEFSASLGQLLNISTRLRVQTGENVLIGGFIITGSEAKKVIARAIGPTLRSPDVPQPLEDPTLELHDKNGTIAFNDDWKDSQQAAIKATGIPPTNDAESAIVKTLPAGNAAYTAIVRGKNNSTGTALVEVFDLDPGANSELANISTRGLVEGGNNLLIGGFIPSNGVTKVIIRALGPSLSGSVAQPLPDPILELHDGNGGIIASNDNWRDTQEAEIAATQIPPPNNAESAIVATLTPGSYTAVVRDATDVSGVALVEVYRLR